MAQKKSAKGEVIESYGVDISRMTSDEKKDTLTIELGQYLSDMSLGPIARGDDNNRDYSKDKKKIEREKIEMFIGSAILLFLKNISELT